MKDLQQRTGNGRKSSSSTAIYSSRSDDGLDDTDTFKDGTKSWPLIGLVGTVGVSVNDSLIMVDQIMKKGRKLGGLTRDHIIEGAAGRLRAIILTTVTTIGGVLPMAYGIGGDAGSA